MKKAAICLLLVFTMVAMAACSSKTESASAEDLLETIDTSASESETESEEEETKESKSAQETEDETSESESLEEESETSDQTSPATRSSDTTSGDTGSQSKPGTGNQNNVNKDASSSKQKSQTGTQSDSTATANANSASKQEQETSAAQKENQAAKEEPASSGPYDYPFDIEQIRQDMISKGTSMGLTHQTTYADGTAITLNNSSWEAPVSGSANFQGNDLKNALMDYVGFFTAENRSAYGGEPLDFFTIHITGNASGGYKFYVLH